MLSKHIKDVVEDIPDNRILNLEELKCLSDQSNTQYYKPLECYKSLGGLCKSSLDITYFPSEDTWEIHHWIDDCFVVYSSTEHMLKSTNLMKYIKQGYLIREN